MTSWTQSLSLTSLWVVYDPADQWYCLDLFQTLVYPHYSPWLGCLNCMVSKLFYKSLRPFTEKKCFQSLLMKLLESCFWTIIHSEAKKTEWMNVLILNRLGLSNIVYIYFRILDICISLYFNSSESIFLGAGTGKASKRHTLKY